MQVCDAVENGLVALDKRRCRAILVALRDRARLGAVADNAPFTAGRLQHQVDDTEMGAPEPRHDGGLAVDRAVGHVDGVPVFVGRGRKHVVVVPRKHGIYALDCGKRHRRVAHEFGMPRGADAGVRQRDDDIGPLLLHHRDIGPRGFDDVAGVYVALQVATVPHHDLWRHEPDQADPDLVRLPGAVDYLLVHHDIGRDQGDILGGVGAEFL